MARPACNGSKSDITMTMIFLKGKSKVCTYADGMCTNSSGTLHGREYIGF